jgi:formyltetrahydrofolate deformylase
MVISNHADLEDAVRALELPYFHVPVEAEDKGAAEAKALDLLVGSDLVVLARYMQILSADFLERIGCPVINIHHSFLPAFPGSDPYQRARDRGVKLIGATAHYVTEELDAGPIIEQEVLRVNHRYTRADLERVGRDVERVVLAARGSQPPRRPRPGRWRAYDRLLMHRTFSQMMGESWRGRRERRCRGLRKDPNLARAVPGLTTAALRTFSEHPRRNTRPSPATRSLSFAGQTSRE